MKRRGNLQSSDRFWEALDEAFRREFGVDAGVVIPDHLEDFVGEDNAVRVVDAFIDALDLVDIGFEGAGTAVTGRPGYHPAVHHLIVAHEVVTTGSDRVQLVGMAQQARAAIGGDEITVVADRGYFSGRQILTCEEAEISAYVPKPLTSSARFAGRFDRRAFIYDADRDCYRCPAGEDLVHRSTATEGTMKIRRY